MKEKETLKKIPKKNAKKEKVNTGSKEELPKSLEVKEDRVTSQNLITTDYMDLEKNVVQAVM